MLTHKDIWQAIDRLAEAFGYSPSGLARKAGLDPTTFNKSKRTSADGKPRWPSTESLSKILAVTGASMSDFLSYIGSGEPGGGKGRTIPVIDFAQAGRAGFFDEQGRPSGKGWDETALPGGGDAGLYALEVGGDSMLPLYRDGDILVVDPGASVRRGDRVVVKTRKGDVIIRELLRQSANRIELKSLNPVHEDLALAPGDVAWTARVLWVSQ